MVEENPRAHEKLSEAVWVYRTSKRDLTGATPFSLTCGHDAVLPVEINVRSARIAYQHSLVHGNYLEAMLVKLDDLDIKRVRAHQHMQVQTRRVVRAYDKKKMLGIEVEVELKQRYIIASVSAKIFSLLPLLISSKSITAIQP
ncbi:uncharacterized protein LOC116188825 [Punica granatum]|uniref:Uncharacterized protein LOC116188825 n=1 Tax=Punica granatum TaxID=22663 RepID=A0A6P8BX08_PUNGR|nr:uncharacterized protein LOC116188825 [Punica granatum]